MSTQPIRFIHSADWQLEVPIGGAPQIPSGLREAFFDAPFTAAERVVQAALDRRVDFVLLAGNILPVETASPYTFEFLLRQFRRLAEQEISVYWMGGELDDLDLWPAQLRLPETVHTFPVGAIERFEVRRNKRLVARLVGQSWRRGHTAQPGDFHLSEDGVPGVGVLYGKPSKRSLDNKGVGYWALGGDHRHRIVVRGPASAAYAGSPQGRRPDQTDAHGAVLVEMGLGEANTQLVETDVWRWRRERIQMHEARDTDEIQQQLVRQASQMTPENPRCGSLMIWAVVCRAGLAEQIYEPETNERLLRALQQASSAESVASLVIEAEPLAPADGLADEDTVLGDFLRAVQRYQQSPDTWHELLDYLPDNESRDSLMAELRAIPDESRQRLWRRVAAWGADLLRGEATVESARSTSSTVA